MAQEYIDWLIVKRKDGYRAFRNNLEIMAGSGFLYPAEHLSGIKHMIDVYEQWEKEPKGLHPAICDARQRIFGRAWGLYSFVFGYITERFCFSGFTFIRGKMPNGYSRVIMGIPVFLWWLMMSLVTLLIWLILTPWFLLIGVWSLCFELPASVLVGER